MAKESKVELVLRNYGNIVQWLSSVKFRPGFKLQVHEYDLICKRPYICGRELVVTGPNRKCFYWRVDHNGKVTSKASHRAAPVDGSKIFMNRVRIFAHQTII